MIEQGSEDWFVQRLGKVTASRMADVMAKTKTGYGAGRKNYMMELLCQRLTGAREEGYVNAAMQRGTDLEPLARAAYEVQMDCTVQEAEFILHPKEDSLGASPDGLVGEEGLIEIKCPNTAQHVTFLQTGKPERKYILQMQTQMACTDREWCDFVSFDDRMPEELQVAIVRVERDDDLINEIMAEAGLFLAELAKLENEMLLKIEEIHGD